MRVLYFTKYSRQGASSRMRSFQYFPYLEKNGLTITVKPLFNDTYLKALYEGRRTAYGAVIKAYLYRFFLLFTLHKYDRIVIEKELFPFLPATAERLLHFFGYKYIVDYDDAIFHNYDLNKNKIFRYLLSNKIDTVMRKSDCVIAGNQYLASRARDAGAVKINVIPTVVDLNRYTMKNHTVHSPITIGWIGTKSTFEKHFLSKITIIRAAVATLNVQFHVIGIDKSTILADGICTFPWSEAGEADAIQQFDIGIMPLLDSAWEKGKCAYKLIQYMACGIPVVASPVGMNIEVVKEGINGYLADTDMEWLSILSKYALDKEKRRDDGLRGREIVQNKYSLQVTQSQLLQLIQT